MKKGDYFSQCVYFSSVWCAVMELGATVLELKALSGDESFYFFDERGVQSSLRISINSRDMCYLPPTTSTR